MSTSKTVEALKREALETLRKHWYCEPASVPVETENVDSPVKLPPAASKSEWPDVLPATGRLYSEAFPDFFEPGMTDFRIPDYRGYGMPEWLAAYVPKTSDYNCPAKLVYDAVLAYAVGSVTHLVGWPGTGKSNGLPVLIAARLGLPLLRLGLNKKGMMLDDLIGREAIKSGEHGTETGHKDGVLIRWIEHPSIILCDEFSRANVEITNGLMSLMERNGALIVENRAHSPVIMRHQHCWLIASDNVKGLGDGADRFFGTEPVDNAVLDRFEVTLEVDYLTVKESMRLVENWFPGFPKKEAKKLCQFGSMIQKGYKKGELPLSFSPRALKECARYACIYQNARDAIRLVVLSKYADDADIIAIREFYRTVYASEL